MEKKKEGVKKMNNRIIREWLKSKDTDRNTKSENNIQFIN